MKLDDMPTLKNARVDMHAAEREFASAKAAYMAAGTTLAAQQKRVRNLEWSQMELQMEEDARVTHGP
jgi:hypothetical protein